jgi:hypothetical protein
VLGLGGVVSRGVSDAMMLAGAMIGAFGWLVTHDADFLIPFSAGFALMLIRAVERVESAVRRSGADRRVSS